LAEYDLAGGQLALANQQLELALAAPDLTSVQAGTISRTS